MPDLSIDVTQFAGPYSALNQRKQVAVSEEQALHAAMTVGTPLLRKGAASARHALAMAAYKAVSIKATVDFSKERLSGFPAFRQLDPSEKTNLSYWVGMVFTAVMSRELLGVEQLLHAACFRPRRIGRTNPSSKSLADLVGRDAKRNWHIFEAKGRQNKASQPDRARWKAQSQTISLIGGKAPKTRSFCIAMVGPTYRAELEDPEGNDGTVQIEFGRGGEDQALLETYYGPLRDVLEHSAIKVARADLSLALTRIAFDAVTNRHVFIGMESRTFDGVRLNELPLKMRSLTGSDYYLGSDGIVVLTSASCDPVQSQP